MRFRLRLAAALICVPVALASAVAIAATRDRFCTLMGGPSGIQVSVPGTGAGGKPLADLHQARRLRRAHPGWSIARVLRALRRPSPGRPEIAKVTVCAGQRCVTRSRPSLSGYVVHPAHDEKRVLLRVVLHHRDGRRQVLRARVALRKSEVNGPGCGTDWVAYARVADDRLVVEDR